MACSPAHRRNMPIILSHRGNLVGPCPSAENRLTTIRAALDCGWGVETDIRCAADGRFYISHDVRPSAHETPAEDFFALFRAYPDATIALNIKELGSEEALIRLLDHEDVAGQTFLFDMELLEQQAGATARTFRELHPTIRIAARISDRRESIEQALSVEVASVIWLDEFDGPSFTEVGHPPSEGGRSIGLRRFARSAWQAGRSVPTSLARIHPLGRRRHLHRLSRSPRVCVAGPTRARLPHDRPLAGRDGRWLDRRQLRADMSQDDRVRGGLQALRSRRRRSRARASDRDRSHADRRGPRVHERAHVCRRRHHPARAGRSHRFSCAGKHDDRRREDAKRDRRQISGRAGRPRDDADFLRALRPRWRPRRRHRMALRGAQPGARAVRVRHHALRASVGLQRPADAQETADAER